MTELIWPISFIGKERYLSGSIHEQPISFLFCSGQSLTAWMSISRTTIFNGRRCNYDNDNIKVHNLKITAPVHHSSLFLLWNLHDSCPSSFWRHMLSRQHTTLLNPYSNPRIMYWDPFCRWEPNGNLPKVTLLINVKARPKTQIWLPSLCHLLPGCISCFFCLFLEFTLFCWLLLIFQVWAPMSPLSVHIILEEHHLFFSFQLLSS